MKKILFVCLLLTAVVALITACGEGDTTTAPAKGSTATTTAQTTAAVTTAAPVYTANVAVNGKSDYTIVYDGSNDLIKTSARNYASKLIQKFGITLKIKDIADVPSPLDKEIIIGDVGDKRPGMNAVKAACREGGDFAVTVFEDDVYLYATDNQCYAFLFAVLLAEKELVPNNKSLTFSSDKAFFYSKSDLKDVNLVSYQKQSGQLSQAFVQSLFSYETHTDKAGTTIPYRLYLPSNYDATKEYPLLVVLHGAGERGNNNESQLAHMIRALYDQNASPLADAIVFCPQCPENQQWVDTPWANGNYSSAAVAESNELKCVIDIIAKLKKDYSVNDERVYAMGLSMGGFGTWDLLTRHSDIFAAGVPICGGGDPLKAKELAKLPIWTFHGSADGVVPPSGTKAMANAINKQNPENFHYEEFQGMDHGIWETVAGREDVLKWLFEQSK